MLARYEQALEATRWPELRSVCDQAGQLYRDGASALEETWPVVKGRRRTWVPGCVSRTNPARAKAAEGPHLGPARPHPVVKVTGSANRRVSLAALIAIKPGRRPWLIYRVHYANGRGDPCKGFTETGFAQLLDAAHQQLGGPLVLVWDNLNARVSAAMAELITAGTG